MADCDGSGTCLICFDFLDRLVGDSKRIPHEPSLYPVPSTVARIAFVDGQDLSFRGLELLLFSSPNGTQEYIYF